MWRTLVVSALLFGCSNKPELSRTKLPGFTIGAPPGAAALPSANSYRTGVAQFELRDHAEPIYVGWQWTEASKVEDVNWLAVEHELQTHVICDHRVISIRTSLPVKDEVARIHRAMAESVRCLPEPGALERSVELLDFSTSNLRRTVVDNSAFNEVIYEDDEVSLLVSMRPEIGVDHEPLDISHNLSYLLGAGVTDQSVTPIANPDSWDKDRQLVSYTATSPEKQPMAGYIVGKKCLQTSAVVYVVITSANGGAADRMMQTVYNANCFASPKY